jgi:hypothetical protein
MNVASYIHNFEVFSIKIMKNNRNDQAGKINLFFCMRFEEQINYFKNENSYLIHE